MNTWMLQRDYIISVSEQDKSLVWHFINTNSKTIMWTCKQCVMLSILTRAKLRGFLNPLSYPIHCHWSCYIVSLDISPLKGWHVNNHCVIVPSHGTDVNNSWFKFSFWRYRIYTSTWPYSNSRVLCCEAVQHKWCSSIWHGKCNLILQM